MFVITLFLALSHYSKHHNTSIFCKAFLIQHWWCWILFLALKQQLSFVVTQFLARTLQFSCSSLGGQGLFITHINIFSIKMLHWVKGQFLICKPSQPLYAEHGEGPAECCTSFIIFQQILNKQTHLAKFFSVVVLWGWVKAQTIVTSDYFYDFKTSPHFCNLFACLVRFFYLLNQNLLQWMV